MESAMTQVALTISLLCCGIVSMQALGDDASVPVLARPSDHCEGCGLYNYYNTQDREPETCLAHTEANSHDGACHFVNNVCVPDNQTFCGLSDVDVSLICMRDQDSPFCVRYGWNWVPVTDESVWDADLEGQLFALPLYELRGACGQANYNQNFAAFMAKCEDPNPDPEGAEWAHHFAFSCFPCRSYSLPD